ncbi:MAG: hypothetical protein HQK87_02075 [Nitrospinae bacterium]|nr:hypothetical protein [Nitrospinota bacterium]
MKRKGHFVSMAVAALIAFGVAACGTSSSNSTDPTPTPTPTVTPTDTPGGMFDTSGAVTNRCDTEGGHAGYSGVDCTKSGCHASMKTMSYAGSAPVGTTVYIRENATGTVWALPVNSQGNFCLRTKEGGNPGGGYRAQTTVPMVIQPTVAGCNATACHDSGRPIQ